MNSRQEIALVAVLSCSITGTLISSASAAPMCNTALGRIAQTAVERAIVENRQTACKELKHHMLAIDKNRALELQTFELCEDGPVVTARISVRVECATSDAAIIRANVADTLSMRASANLENCTVFDTRVSANGFLNIVGLDWASINQEVKNAAAREIQPYCKK